MVFALTFMLALLTNPLMVPHAVVPKQMTPITEIELVEVLQEAHIEVFGAPAAKARLSVAWAQVALENGRGRTTYNYNLGNIGPYRGFPYYKQGLSKFRAFPDFQAAARVYWELLRDRCSAALRSFEAMNAPYTALLLRRCGYHRSEIERYASGLGSLMWSGYRLLG